MDITVDAYGATDVGKRRDKNEDQFFIGEVSNSMKVQLTSIAIDDCATVFGRPQGHLFLVADGLGGHAAGERASALAIAAVTSYALNELQWLSECDPNEEQPEKLQAIAKECQTRLADSARQHPDERGMATTLTLAIVVWPKLYVIHIGDSRCYLLRGKRLERLTRDHTMGQLYSEVKDLPFGEKASHVLWNVVSSDSHAEPIADIVNVDLVAGDQLLLCTDGLFQHLEDAELEEVLIRNTAERRSTQSTCEQLIATANERGGRDNITAVVSRFASPPARNDNDVMVETRVPMDELIEPAEPVRRPDDTDEFPVSDSVLDQAPPVTRPDCTNDA